MRVLVVPEPLLGLPAADVGAVVADAVRQAGAELGTPTAVRVLDAPLPDAVDVVTVPDPWGRPAPSACSVRGDVAVLHALDAAGPALRRPGDDPAAASSAGIGALVAAAVDAGARTVVLPLDDLACHDAGLGMLRALAGEPDGAGSVLDAPAARALIGAARERLRGARLVGRFEDDVPLLGLGGASATQGEAKGMTARQAQDAEGRLGALADVLRRAQPQRLDLLTGAPLRPDREPGAGAGGGAGFAVLLLGGVLEDRWAADARERGLDAAVGETDLVVVTTDRFDWRTLRSSLVARAAQAAAPRAVPVVLVAGELEAGRREAMSLGVDGLYAVVEEPRRRARVLADPRAALAARALRVARTWLRR